MKDYVFPLDYANLNSSCCLSYHARIPSFKHGQRLLLDSSLSSSLHQERCIDIANVWSNEGLQVMDHWAVACVAHWCRSQPKEKAVDGKLGFSTCRRRVLKSSLFALQEVHEQVVRRMFLHWISDFWTCDKASGVIRYANLAWRVTSLSQQSKIQNSLLLKPRL